MNLEQSRAIDRNAILLEKTRSFWNDHPCDGQSGVFQRMEYRYRKEPWLPLILDEIVQFENVLELGCGQGTDAIYCCQRMRKGSSYIALDGSNTSIDSASKSVETIISQLNIVPEFTTGNVESLEFPDKSFECIISIGVFHHTPDTQRAIDEVYRVLKAGGTAYIFLYRLLSPKLLIAHTARLIAKIIDVISGKERILYRLLRRLGSNHSLGTMLLEGLGVPILRSYTKTQLRRMFDRFILIQIHPIGMGLPWGFNPHFDKRANPFGALWLIKVTKIENGYRQKQEG